MRNERLMRSKEYQVTLEFFLLTLLLARWFIDIFFFFAAECGFPVLPFFIASISIRNLQVVSN